MLVDKGFERRFPSTDLNKNTRYRSESDPLLPSNSVGSPRSDAGNTGPPELAGVLGNKGRPQDMRRAPADEAEL